MEIGARYEKAGVDFRFARPQKALTAPWNSDILLRS
jgi:hypothetical protein